jgi:hypothetical protein
MAGRKWIPAALLVLTLAATPVPHDGRHDFDFEFGTWNIAVHRLVHPLSGSSAWVSPKGYVHIVRKVWDGGASLAQLEVLTPAPHFLGLMLRMYDPRSQRWNVYWGDAASGELSQPLVGRFANGRGEFFGRDTLGGKPIVVRVIYSDITPTSFHTEQSFSPDGGKTWQPNLEQTFTRIGINPISR